MTDLKQLQQNAISLAANYKNHRAEALDTAAQCGKTLIDIKTQLNHGEFESWVEENMPVGIRQCQKMMQLYKKKPELISNTNSNSLFDLDSELRLIATTDDIEKIVRAEAKEQEFSQVKIAKRIKELENPTAAASPKAALTFEKYLANLIKLTNKAKVENNNKPGQWQTLITDIEAAINTAQKPVVELKKAA